MYKLYIKNNHVYYSNSFTGEDGIITNELMSLRTTDRFKDSNYCIEYHSSYNHILPDNIILEMIELLKEYSHDIAININEFINKLPDNTFYQVGGSFVRVAYPNGENEKYIDYDTHYISEVIIGYVSSGYYWGERLKRNSDRIGRRKVYINTKGMYFKENGYREYFKDYIIKGGK